MIFRHKKQFGQNFLTDIHAIQKMCDAAHVQEEDFVVEIGPGKGVLTSALLERGATVCVIEKDNDLIPILEERFFKEVENKKLKIIHKDVRDISVDDLPNNGYKLVANIPYYITGEIIRDFLTRENKPTSITLLVQDEVAKRICQENKGSLLRLSVLAYGEPKYIKRVKAGSFNPPPKVDSAIIHISNISRDKFENVNEEIFFEVLHVAFNQKRKTLLKSLSSKYSKDLVLQSLNSANIDPKTRPEELSLSDWLLLSSTLHQN